MPRYIYMFRGLDREMEALSEKEMQQVMSRWSAWASSLRERGAWQGGDRLAPPARVVKNGGVVSDGPFAEAKEHVAGFFIVECGDMDEAVELAKGCPGLSIADATVEVRPLRD